MTQIAQLTFIDTNPKVSPTHGYMMLCVYSKGGIRVERKGLITIEVCQDELNIDLSRTKKQKDVKAQL